MDLQGGPTFEDLSIDDELSQLQRVVRYSSSSIALQRLVHVKMLAETVAAVGFEETVKSIVPLLGPLAADQELVVRQHLGEQLDEIARLCRSVGKEAGYRLIIETILPTLTKLLGDSQAEVRQAAGESLIGVAGLMKPLDLGQHVLTIVLQLAHDDEQEELRMTAAALLNDLAESLGNDLCKQFVTPEMVSLSEDPVFRVRKATALNLHKICKVVGEAGIQRLLPAYVRLTKDDVYRVRKACTEALVDMSKAIGPEVSLRELTPVFMNLASDSSKLVRTGALQHLGKLISTLPGEAVTEELVRYFTATAVESMGDPVVDAELRGYCAYSFPAVVVTIGPNRWGELRESFAALLRDPSWSVRRSLSHSLHEVAKVLKTEDVEMDLVPAMEAFLRDMEDVRLGVIRHLAAFFEQMSPARRERHLNVLVEILQTTSAFNWRLREVLAQQLPKLAPLLTLDSVFFAVVPVAFGLLNDPVAVVRERTFEVVAPLLRLTGAHSNARQASMVSRVRELAHAPTYQARQMYVYICHSMACAGSQEDRHIFIQEFVPSLAELARDRVVNVRIAMSRTLSKCPDWVMELPDIRRAIHLLVKDSNRDVRHFVSFLPPIVGHDPSQEDKVLWVDTSSVLSDESVLTQWSVSTQRSMLSVGDFPHLKDASSPNRSLKLSRQRSSSVESAGESGNSTTSSEGDPHRLSSRRPPLPAGWGMGSSSNAQVAPASGGVVEAGAKPDEAPLGGDGSDPAAGGVWGAGVEVAIGGGMTGEAEVKETTSSKSGDEIRETDGEVEAVSPAGTSGVGHSASAAGAVREGDGAMRKDGDGFVAAPVSLHPAPGDGEAGRAQVASKSGGEAEGAVGSSSIVAVSPADGSASLSDKMEALALGDDVGVVQGASREGVLPPTPLPSPVPQSSALRPSASGADVAGGSNPKDAAGASGGEAHRRLMEEPGPVGTGDEDGKVAADGRGAARGAGGESAAAVVEVGGKEQGGSDGHASAVKPPRGAQGNPGAVGKHECPAAGGALENPAQESKEGQPQAGRSPPVQEAGGEGDAANPGSVVLTERKLDVEPHHLDGTETKGQGPGGDGREASPSRGDGAPSPEVRRGDGAAGKSDGHGSPAGQVVSPEPEKARGTVPGVLVGQAAGGDAVVGGTPKMTIEFGTAMAQAAEDAREGVGRTSEGVMEGNGVTGEVEVGAGATLDEKSFAPPGGGVTRAVGAAEGVDASRT